MPKRVIRVARGDAKAGRLCQPCNARSARFGMNPAGTGRMRRMPVLRLLAVATATTRRRALACNA